jgi:transcriptional regulator with XRE-family HTH domain
MGIARQSPPSPELKVFSDRIQKAIEFKKIDLAALAKDLDYKPEDIRRLLVGMREPSMKKLMLLANSLGCSVDYLLGLAPEARRADVVVEVDADAIKPPSSERGRTSGQISGKAGRLVAMASELPEFDVELLDRIAGFLIERKEKGLLKFVKIVKMARQNSKEETEKVESAKNFTEGSNGKVGLGAGNSDFDGDDLDEDELWDDANDDIKKKGLDDEDFEDDDDFDGDCFDD